MPSPTMDSNLTVPTSDAESWIGDYYWDYDVAAREQRARVQLEHLRRVKAARASASTSIRVQMTPRQVFNTLGTVTIRRGGSRPRRRPSSPRGRGTPLSLKSALLAGLQDKTELRTVPENEIRDNSEPKLSGFLTEEHISAYQLSCLDANIEEWYELLGPTITFRSEFVRMDPEDAKMLVRGIETFHATGYPSLSCADAERLAALEGRLSLAISAVETAPDAGAFVKTSSRSAKDAAPALATFETIFKAALAMRTPCDGRGAQIADENTRLIAMLEAGNAVLRVNAATEAIASLLRSERIFQDMKLALDHPSRFNEHLIARQWVPIDPDMEFRGFVYDGKLTAVSQYNHLAYFERLPGMMQGLIDRIVEFYYTMVAPKIASEFPQCIVDFAVTGDELDRVWVIEINPFLETTDAALFSWSHDLEVLKGRSINGNSGPVWRVTVAPKSGAMAMIQREWREVCGRFEAAAIRCDE